MYSNFHQIRVCRSVKRVHKSICKNVVSCINLQIAIRIIKNHAFLTCTTPQPMFRPILRSIKLKLTQQ